VNANEILKIDVSKHIEKKNNLSYLSWAWAWDQALRIDPKADFHVETFQKADATTVPYMDVNGTAMVWVRVTLLEKSRTCMLPVMDHRNKPIPNPDAFQVNTAIMRCMTKCLALFGLGLYIYAGEDIPSEEPAKPDPQKEANASLFADGMIEYVDVSTTLSGLKSYWKANLTQLDDLKINHPALYEKVRAVFQTKKAKFEAEEKEPS